MRLVTLFVLCREVSTSHDLMDVIHMAMKRRAEGVTNVHSHSSRSHLVVTITILSSLPSVSSTPMITPQGSPYKTTSSITVHVSYLCGTVLLHYILTYFNYELYFFPL